MGIKANQAMNTDTKMRPKNVFDIDIVIDYFSEADGLIVDIIKVGKLIIIFR